MTWPHPNQFADRSHNALAYQAREANNKRLHNCLYMLMRRTIKMTGSHQQWMERCRCGRLRVVDWNMIGDGGKSPALLKHWYDQNGNFVKTTGKMSASDIEISSRIQSEYENNA